MTKRCLILALLLTNLLTANTATAGVYSAPNTVDLTPYLALYQSKIKGVTVELQRELQQLDDKNWQLQNSSKVLFTELSEQSRLAIHEGRASPSYYHYENPLSKSRSSELFFDWSAQTVSDKDHPAAPLALPFGAQDRLSAQLQIRLDLIASQGDLKKRSYPVVDSTKLKTYHIKKLGEEVISTPAGKFPAVKIKQYRKGKDKYNIIWLAENMEYLIVRLDVIDQGELRDSMQLIDVQFANPPGTAR